MRHVGIALASLAISCGLKDRVKVAPPIVDGGDTVVVSDFLPIEPTDATIYWDDDDPIPYDDLNGNTQVPDTNEERLSAFPIEAAQIKILKIEAGGNVTAPIASAGGKGSEYVVILDYVKYRTDETPEGCVVQTGVGIRMRARLVTMEANVNISTPFGLAAAASAGKLQGTLTFQSIGVHGKTVSPLVPMPSKLSEESIQNGIVAASAIKASLYTDGDVLIRPQVFGHKPADKCRDLGTEPSHAVDNEPTPTAVPPPAPKAATEESPE